MQIERRRYRLVRPSRGVTLIELLTVVAIVGILSAVIWVAVAGRVKTAAKQTQIKSDMRQVVMAVNLYRNDNDSGLPSNWRSFGYYGVNRKGVFGGGFPPKDAYYDKPPSYDVSYQTPECAQSPKANMGFYFFRQAVSAFESRPRANQLDIEHDQATSFSPACLVSSLGEHRTQIKQGEKVVTITAKGYRSLGANLSGTLSYQWDPDWLIETEVSH